MTSTLTDQSRNLVGATIGASIGLATVANLVTWQVQHESIIAAAVAAGLILFLSHIKQQSAKTTALCCVLGFACARLTISLIE
jgi:Na+/phosphate symporter